MLDLTKAKKIDKKGLDYLKRYLYSKYTRLNDCYTSCSNSKYNAYIYNLNLMDELDGKCLKIIGFNCNFFTIGFIIKKQDVTYFVVNTGRNIYIYYFDNIKEILL